MAQDHHGGGARQPFGIDEENLVQEQEDPMLIASSRRARLFKVVSLGMFAVSVLGVSPLLAAVVQSPRPATTTFHPTTPRPRKVRVRRGRPVKKPLNVLTTTEENPLQGVPQNEDMVENLAGLVVAVISKNPKLSFLTVGGLSLAYVVLTAMYTRFRYCRSARHNQLKKPEQEADDANASLNTLALRLLKQSTKPSPHAPSNAVLFMAAMWKGLQMISAGNDGDVNQEIKDIIGPAPTAGRIDRDMRYDAAASIWMEQDTYKTLNDAFSKALKDGQWVDPNEKTVLQFRKKKKKDAGKDGKDAGKDGKEAGKDGKEESESVSDDGAKKDSEEADKKDSKKDANKPAIKPVYVDKQIDMWARKQTNQDLVIPKKSQHYKSAPISMASAGWMQPNFPPEFQPKSGEESGGAFGGILEADYRDDEDLNAHVVRFALEENGGNLLSKLWGGLEWIKHPVEKWRNSYFPAMYATIIVPHDDVDLRDVVTGMSERKRQWEENDDTDRPPRPLGRGEPFSQLAGATMFQRTGHGMSRSRVHMDMPAGKAISKHELKHTLQQFGMSAAFKKGGARHMADNKDAKVANARHTAGMALGPGQAKGWLSLGISDLPIFSTISNCILPNAAEVDATTKPFLLAISREPVDTSAPFHEIVSISVICPDSLTS